MTAGWCSRTVRAAVFAVVCVLLTDLGHTMMSDVPVPWWALAAGAAATGGTAWCLAARERGLLAVTSVAVVAQAVLHSFFSLAQALVRPALPGDASVARQWAWYLLSGSPGTGSPHGSMGPMHDMAGMGGADGLDTTGPAGHIAHMGHAVGGMSSSGVLAAHLLAALLCGLWLAHGERAAFRLLRVLAGWLVAPLRLSLAPPAPPARPLLRARRTPSDRAPRRLLVHAITSRGPPAGAAVV
ncbi:hypothetical protein [Streptomyces sp. 6N223]|uniref:hypothetical protein n=1 Tax=Streptomyces sp. 6N223 TaxID=3457412 RepID=UPI003FD2E93E